MKEIIKRCWKCRKIIWKLFEFKIHPLRFHSKLTLKQKLSPSIFNPISMLLFLNFMIRSFNFWLVNEIKYQKLFIGFWLNKKLIWIYFTKLRIDLLKSFETFLQSSSSIKILNANCSSSPKNFENHLSLLNFGFPFVKSPKLLNLNCCWYFIKN